MAALVQGRDLVQQVLVTVAAEQGLTPQQAKVLCIVDHAPVSMRQLSGLLRIRKSSVTGLVDRAHSAGLIVRTPDPCDGRSWLVDFTPEGRAAVRRFKRAVTERLEHMISRFAPRECADLDALLSKLVLDDES